MSDSELDAEALPPDDEEALKKRLLNRIALAGVVVITLLGGLAIFDAMYVPAPKRAVATRAPDFASPADVKLVQGTAPETRVEPKADAREEPKAEVADVTRDGVKPVTAETVGAPAPAPTAAAGKPAKVEPPAPAKALPPPEPPVAMPEGTALAQGRGDVVPLKPLTPPATARPVMLRPAEPLAASRVAPEGHRPLAPRPPASAVAPLSRPLSQAVHSASGFVLQLGVFSNIANAEELRAKLELNGIASQIEARVQVGPFATRAQAEAARERLRAIGLDNGILTAVRK